VTLVERQLTHGSAEELRGPLMMLLHDAQGVQERMRSFPTLDLYYRSCDPTLDPERMMRVMSDAALAARVAAEAQGMAALAPVADELLLTSEAFMYLVAAQLLSRREREALWRPDVGRADRETAERLRERLAQRLPALSLAPADDPVLLASVAKGRRFIGELERLVGETTGEGSLDATRAT
jgi:hypothetical protein